MTKPKKKNDESGIIEVPEDLTQQDVKQALKNIRRGLLSINWKKRGKIDKNYYINKKLFYFFEVLYFIVAFATILTNWTALQTAYSYCPIEKTENCVNPYYVGLDLCDKDYCKDEIILAGGSVGTPVNWLYPNGIYIALLFWVSPYLINHFYYNKNNKFWMVVK